MLNISIIVFISHPCFNKERDGVSPLRKKIFKVLSDRIINELIYEGKTWGERREQNSRGKNEQKTRACTKILWSKGHQLSKNLKMPKLPE